MNTFHGSVWELYNLMKEPRWQIVIPTNVGWKLNGCNVMGRGLASEAAALYPHLSHDYGLWCRARGAEPFYYEKGRIWCIPSKSLDTDHPHMSWQGQGSLPLVRRGLVELKQLLVPLARCAVPLIGAGNGGLNPKSVQKLITSILGEDDRFTLVLYDQEVA